MRVLVMTVVHTPEDARILHREIRALVEAGHEVVHAAPFTAFGVVPRSWVSGIDLPRATERRRIAAILAARALFRRMRDQVDIVIVHDPELLLAVLGLRRRPPVVWDVHEDTPATLSLKSWLPRIFRPPVRMMVRWVESFAERRLHVLLAEYGYAQRFRGQHLVVPNETWVADTVSPPDDDRVIYLGWLSHARGAKEAIEAAKLLRPHGIGVELIGYADTSTRIMLENAVADGLLEWRDFLPNDEALKRLDGALAGISLLRDEPNYRHSMPTKVIEYMAHGIPVVTTPTPRAAELIGRYHCGVVVPWRDPEAVAQAVLRLKHYPAERRAQGRRGHQAAWQHHHWPRSARRFVAQVERWAVDGRR